LEDISFIVPSKILIKKVGMNLKNITAVFFSLCYAVFVAGCATSDDVGRVQWEISDIRAEISAIKEEDGIRLVCRECHNRLRGIAEGHD